MIKIQNIGTAMGLQLARRRERSAARRLGAAEMRAAKAKTLAARSRLKARVRKLASAYTRASNALDAQLRKRFSY